MSNTKNFLKPLGRRGNFFSLPAYAQQEKISLSRLPVSIRVMLESLLRHCDGKMVKESDVSELARWNAKKPSQQDIPFIVARVVLQDFTGVPLLVDLAAMRDAVAGQGKNSELIEPLVPVDLVVDHSVQVDHYSENDSFLFNLRKEFERNQERYSFLKWGQEAFKTFKVVPPGIGIVHQVNLEHFASVVTQNIVESYPLFYPDTLVGTDSHTTMINGMGVLGWGVGGIEAEAAMLGQPVFMKTPEVIGVLLKGKLREGVTATDLTLKITEILRKKKVVGKFVEYFGEGAASLTVADRATIGNMAPEYGATIGFFPTDEKTLDYLLMTGRPQEQVNLVKEYLTAQGLFGIPREGEIDYTEIVELDLNTIEPSVSGPKRPQDLISLKNLKNKFLNLLTAPYQEGGYNKEKKDLSFKICVQADGSFPLLPPHPNGGTPFLDSSDHRAEWSEEEMVTNRPFTNIFEEYAGQKEALDTAAHIVSDICDIILTHGTIVIAAITSCTNTSNPSVMVAAGLLARKAVEKGLRVNPKIKTSLAPGSRVVTDYLTDSGLQPYLDELGFKLVAYGCTTCIGNSGPLEPGIESAIKEYDLITASVLSGNRNFEARIHSSVKANFLMSPPLVVAFAIAGRVDIDLDSEPLGYDKNKQPIFLKDLWPSDEEIQEVIKQHLKPQMYKERYLHIMRDNPIWKKIEISPSPRFPWDSASTYIQKPPYFENFSLHLPHQEKLGGMRALALFGDSVTTDHISPAGSIKASTPAGLYLLSKGVEENEFNSYGSRRGNHDVMMRGTFSNVRIRNFMADGKEGGFTKLMPEGKIMTIFEASEEYKKRGTPLIVFAGSDYGMGSSRDWAAKGAILLGVKVVVAKTFERIHRSNLIGMGILPLEFNDGDNVETLGLTGEEEYSIVGFDFNQVEPGQQVTLEIKKGSESRNVKLLLRLDTQSEIDYYRHGGIMPYVLRQLLQKL